MLEVIGWTFFEKTLAIGQCVIAFELCLLICCERGH